MWISSDNTQITDKIAFAKIEKSFLFSAINIVIFL